MRIGIGFDSHRLVKGRKLFLGGVEIDYEKGLEGISDADVLIHALCDALLGAMGGKDLGQLFPENDPQNKDRASKEFLLFVKKKIKQKSFKIVNIDMVLILKEPLILPHKDKIRKNLASLLEIEPDYICLKAKHPEGFFSKDEFIASIVVVLLSKS